MVSIGEDPRFHIVAEGVQFRVEDAAGGVGAVSTSASARCRRFRRPAFRSRPCQARSNSTCRRCLPATPPSARCRIRAEPSEAGWRLASVNATLPGRTALEASGDLTVGDELGFSRARCFSRSISPSGFASWLSRDVDESIRRLPVAGIQRGRRTGRAPARSYRDLELVLGNFRHFAARSTTASPMDARAVDVTAPRGRWAGRRRNDAPLRRSSSADVAKTDCRTMTSISISAPRTCTWPA
jgi:hypothetical protein